MSDFDLHLAKAHLEQQGYLVALSIPAPGSSPVKFDDVIDLFGLKLENGKAVHGVVGCVKGWWQGKRYLTPSVITFQLGEQSGILSTAFSEIKFEFLRKLFNLGDEIEFEQMLFFPQRSPQKAEQAEQMLEQMQIKPIYLADLIAEMLPRLRRDLAGNPLEWLTDLRRMRNSPLVLESLDNAKREKELVSQDDRDEPSPQLSFFAGKSRQ
ncbi:MAG: hypothetical protein P9M14_02715 [Candidatus Alcyoniella australis]|nr:hypothetical protein [Candidatus Alcyoniella australis]